MAKGLNLPAGLCLLIVALTVIMVLAPVVFPPEKKQFRGLLIDLEYGQPDRSRYGDLRRRLTEDLPNSQPQFHDSQFLLDYAHFTTVTADDLGRRDVRFLILSPQGTPWHKYDGDAGRKLCALREFLKRVIAEKSIPTLGICGGHQFLALTYGGSVDFIDPAYVGSLLDRYPTEAMSERGIVELTTTMKDPILNGVTEHPGAFNAVESHFEEVKTLPDSFVNIAESALSKYQFIRLRGKPVYGVAFHPERCWEEQDCRRPGVDDGKRILSNFLTLVQRGGAW